MTTAGKKNIKKIKKSKWLVLVIFQSAAALLNQSERGGG